MRTLRRSKRVRMALAATGGWLVACNPAAYDAASPGSCRESGEQCMLAKGPLGVCERASCAEGEAEPCFVCTPQH